MYFQFQDMYTKLCTCTVHMYLHEVLTVSVRAARVCTCHCVQVGKPEGERVRSKWRQLFTRRKKKAVLACFLAVPYFEITK